MIRPEYNINQIAEMGGEQSLRNFCRQIEYEHVDQRRPASYRSCRIQRLWPGMPQETRVQFITGIGRKVAVLDADGSLLGEFPLTAGVASRLYVAAGEVIGNEN